MKVSDLFELKQGNGFELINMQENALSDINFVSRTSNNNGVVAKVDRIIEQKPFEAGLITVALGGSVLSTFVQVKPFYTGFHIMVLKPKKEMKLNEKLYYAMCINKNAYKYGYGRQANKTLKDIIIPDEIPQKIINTPIKFDILKTKNLNNMNKLDIKCWKKFTIKELFDVVLSKGDIQLDSSRIGDIPLVSSGEQNNGIIGYIDEFGDGKAQIFSRNKITVDMFLNPFYQDIPFFASSHGRVNILIPKFELTKNIALFICTVIKCQKFKFSYGRAVYSKVIEKLEVELPYDNNGNPNWQYIERYMEILPYADKI